MSGVSIDDILQHIDSDDSLDHGMAGASDDLGMDTDYDYESDSSLEGIVLYSMKHPK
jgi:hypothetical protein